MAQKKTVLLVGTRKGLFVIRSDDRRKWRTTGPHFPGLSIFHAFLDPHDAKGVWAAVESWHWGPTVAYSKDFGKSWKRHSGPTYEKGTGLSVQRIWHLGAGLSPGELWAGVEPAGLFRSEDAGATWASMEGLNGWPGRDKWMPGGGGLCLHTILPYPGQPKRLIVGSSAVGTLGSGDGGTSWRLMNGGVSSELTADKVMREDQHGSCVHKMVRDPKDPDLLYMQNHWGIYRRRRGDDAWTDISKGLPSRFGFAMAAHPNDAGRIYTVPLEADTNRVAPGGAFAVHTSDDGGRRWRRLAKGLPQKGAWHTVLREGLATDGHDPAGVYVGTTTGQLYASRNEGATWGRILDGLPPILSVQAGTLDGASR